MKFVLLSAKRDWLPYFVGLLSLIMIPCAGYSQDPDGIVDTAAYTTRIQKLKENLELYGTRKRTLLELTGKYSMLGKADSAFRYLDLAIDTGFRMIETFTYGEYSNLREDDRWPEYRRAFENIWKEYYPKGDIEYASLIVEMFRTDQLHRYFMEIELERYGPGSERAKAREKLTKMSDSLNIRVLDSLISSRGWPSVKLVGRKQLEHAFFILLHAPLEYKKKYYNRVQLSAESGELQKNLIAYFLDKMCFEEGKKQIFGTQFTRNPITAEIELYELAHPELVDSLRMSVGLDSLYKYVNHMRDTY